MIPNLAFQFCNEEVLKGTFLCRYRSQQFVPVMQTDFFFSSPCGLGHEGQKKKNSGYARPKNDTPARKNREGISV